MRRGKVMMIVMWGMQETETNAMHEMVVSSGLNILNWARGGLFLFCRRGKRWGRDGAPLQWSESSELGRAAISTPSSSARGEGGRVHAPLQFSERSELRRAWAPLAASWKLIGGLVERSRGQLGPMWGAPLRPHGLSWSYVRCASSFLWLSGTQRSPNPAILQGPYGIRCCS
eukprot:9468138-Pyramimonas_sp.AAC.1